MTLIVGSMLILPRDLDASPIDDCPQIGRAVLPTDEVTASESRWLITRH
jgi:hypothetical protein